MPFGREFKRFVRALLRVHSTGQGTNPTLSGARRLSVLSLGRRQAVSSLRYADGFNLYPLRGLPKGIFSTSERLQPTPEELGSLLPRHQRTSQRPESTSQLLQSTSERFQSDSQRLQTTSQGDRKST